MTLYEQIGEEKLVAIVTEFYSRAFKDMIIGHFFFGKDQAALTAHQINFARGMLGGPNNYDSRPLRHAHQHLKLRPPHFARRQLILSQVMDHYGLATAAKVGWLGREESLRSQIMRAIKP